MKLPIRIDTLSHEPMFLSLYQIQKTTPDAYIVRLDPNNTVFRVHFEGNPILPGACMLEIARELLEKKTAKSLRITRINNLKFIQVVSPIAFPEIGYFMDIQEKEDHCLSAKVQVSNEDKSLLFAKISLELQSL